MLGFEELLVTKDLVAFDAAARHFTVGAGRAFEVFLGCWEEGVLLRAAGDNIAISPPLIVNDSQIDQIVSTLEKVIKRVA